jgi:hypothetical protein
MPLRVRPELGRRLAALRAHPRVRRLRAALRLHRRALLAGALAGGIILMVIHWS